MYHLAFPKATIKTACFVLFSAFLLQTALQSLVFGQSGQGGGTSSSQGITGADVSQSELTSKASQMPRFSGFSSLDQRTFIGADGTYFPPRASSGQQTSSSSARTTTATRTTNRTAANTRNRTTTGMMGNMGRMGGIGGTNTNTVRSVTSLGYSFNETAATLRPEQTQAVRVSRLENRISNNSRINALAPIMIEIDGSTAILQGVVENEHQRKLLEQYVKLEPGIVKVQNELTLPAE